MYDQGALVSFLIFPVAFFMKVSNELFFSFVVKVINKPNHCDNRKLTEAFFELFTDDFNLGPRSVD